MLSQTKMQLWYPKKNTDDRPGNSVAQYRHKYMDIPEEKDETIKSDRDSPASSLSDRSDANEEVIVDFLSEDDSCSRIASSVVSDCDETVDKKRKRMEDVDKVSDFVDLDYWKKETMCCGTIFRGMYDEIMVDPRFMKPCSNRLAKIRQISENKAESQTEILEI